MSGIKNRKDNLPLAVGMILFTVFALSLGDAFIKRFSSDFVLWQIFVVRSLIAVPCLLGFILVLDRDALNWPPAVRWVVVRSMCLVAMWIFYYLSLPHLALSAAAASYYTLPIFITLFSAWFIGDRISTLGWFAVLLGFVGVILILRPRAGDFNGYALLPLASAMCYAVAMILTRTKCRDVMPLMLSLALNLSFIAVGLLATLLVLTTPSALREGFIFGVWIDLGASEWIAMALLAGAILIGSIGAAIAYQNGPPAVIGTFDFAYVGFAVIWGLLLFGEFPDSVSLLGMACIVIAGILSLRQQV